MPLMIAAALTARSNHKKPCFVSVCAACPDIAEPDPRIADAVRRGYECMWDYGISGRNRAAGDTKAVPPVRFGTTVPSAVSAFETVGKRLAPFFRKRARRADGSN
ncbi:hypothetical protein OZ411_17935 [Bradyrhizobium sp. Arg237L]|uniref:hypothetical protein n=1 Tax=Bradyrhizobium sp. Arg237L TaxID=3003352 RepID=UPI00249F4BDD|nr:hypothetical protein [Bradyrhizobium sp. Arg237L]MDI4234686.1 hypothetical protein [Bradyrhizobium sp. Arg237L]